MKKIIGASLLVLFWATSVWAAPAYFSQINASNLNSNNGRGSVVAILDSGIQLDNPDLMDNLWHNNFEIPDDGLDNDHNGFIDDYYGWDFVANSNDPNPKLDDGYIAEGISHGTAIAGLVAAKDTYSGLIQGLATQSKVMPIRVLSGSGEGDVEGVNKAIKYAVNNGANVINLSFVSYDLSTDLTNTIKWAYDRGVVVVAAAGNGNASSSIGLDLKQTLAYPICQSAGNNFREILGVASVDSLNRKSDFSNYGGGCINISAPGEGLLTITYKTSSISKLSSGYALLSGTSFSAALVSAVAALLKAKNPGWSAKNIIEAITNSAKDLNQNNPQYLNQLGGLLDVGSALNYNSNTSFGRLIKTQKSNAVYFVDNNGYRYLFTSEAVFFSWFNPPWSKYRIEVVSADEFDNLKVGKNISVRPGSLVKFDNSDLVYVVNNEHKLCPFESSDVASRLYGVDFYKKTIKLTAAFQADYVNDRSCVIGSDSVYPDGSIISYRDASGVYYIDGGQKFLFTDNGLRINEIKDNWITKNVDQSIQYPTALIIDDYKNLVFPYKLNN